ncbi:hypothetical protein [Methylobacillus glycogenes]|uniref:hypothetical protein n=1 Tax=Methylobacillus glycogenes TaxID=406 RepID=UPI003F71B412
MEKESLISHFRELRTRFIWILAGILAPMLALIPFANELHSFFIAPLMRELPAGGR